jgi:predicted negative regulator of RcsB-dependent stress response
MASPSVARRAPRHEVETDDVVMMRAAELAQWARNNARAVMFTAVALLVAVGAVLYYQYYKTQRAGRAASAYLQVQATLPNDTAQAIRTLQNFTNQFPGTNEADEARIAAAQILLAKGDANRAITTVRPAADGSSSVAQNAQMVLADAQAQAGKRQEAIAGYLDVAKSAKLDYVRRNALNQAALLREQGNDYKGAAELYTQMLDGLEKGSGERQIVELHLAEAQAHAGITPAAQQ